MPSLTPRVYRAKFAVLDSWSRMAVALFRIKFLLFSNNRINIFCATQEPINFYCTVIVLVCFIISWLVGAC